MRVADSARLSQPYAGGPDPGDLGAASALGVGTPTWNTLEERILGDLVDVPPYGIAWWAPHPGASRRILISDQLYACTSSVPVNLIEAGLHWLEFLDAVDAEDGFQANAVQIVGGRITVRARPRTSPLESLLADRIRLHQVGVVTALSGALDCVGGAIIGVVALPLNILRADFGGIVRHLANLRPPATDGEQRQHAFAARLSELTARLGPPSWLDWLLSFRNMLVHRGRRIEMAQFVLRDPMLFGPEGRPVPRVRVVHQLPVEPGRSDVQVLRHPRWSPVLSEDAQQTLAGVIESVRGLVDAIGGELVRFWEWRRENPAALTQPPAQWPQVELPDDGPETFMGYAPNTYPYNPDQLMSGLVIRRRMLAAALFDHQRHQWAAFD